MPPGNGGAALIGTVVEPVTEIALDVAPRGYRKVDPSPASPGTPIETGMIGNISFEAQT